MSTFTHSGMTPVSGISITSKGYFEIGVETFFRTVSNPGSANIATVRLVSSYDFSVISFNGISVALRPPTFTYRFLKGPQVYITDGLFRIWFNKVMVSTIILKSTSEPANIVVPAFTAYVEPVGEETIIKVEFQGAGASEPVNMELQASGKLS